MLEICSCLGLKFDLAFKKLSNYNVIMSSYKLKIVQIGNSMGVRIPKTLLAQCGLEDEVEVEVTQGGLMLKPIKQSLRADWANAFEKDCETKDSTAFDIANSFDQGEWEW